MKELLNLSRDLRLAKPDEDVGKLVARTEMRQWSNGEAYQAELMCEKCKTNVWEERNGKFYCWNCDDAPKI